MSERQLTIVLFCVMGGIILIGAGALYWLQFQELAQLEEDLRVVSAQVDEALRKKAAIPGLEAKVKGLNETIERIRQQIPVFTKDENDQFANLVDQLRKKCRVLVYDPQLKSGRSGTGEAVIPKGIFRARYEFKAVGGFYQLLNFLNHLETERRFLVAENIKLVSGPAPEGRGVVPVRELQLTLSTFMQRPSPVVAGPPTPPKPGDKPPEPPPEEPRRVSTPVPD